MKRTTELRSTEIQRAEANHKETKGKQQCNVEKGRQKLFMQESSGTQVRTIKRRTDSNTLVKITRQQRETTKSGKTGSEIQKMQKQPPLTVTASP